MSTKLIIITQITNFINDLNTSFPDNSDIKIFKEKFTLLKGINSQLIIDYLIKFIYPHKDKIMKEDEIFFVEGGGQEKINDTNGLNLRDNIRGLWVNEISNENKKIVWKYFKTFILLLDKYIVENVK